MHASDINLLSKRLPQATHVCHDNCVRRAVLQWQCLCPPCDQAELVSRMGRLGCLPRVAVHGCVAVHSNDAIHVLGIQLQVGGGAHACGWGVNGRQLSSSYIALSSGNVQAL